MHFYKHLTQGRVSELIGPPGLAIDKFIRISGMPRAARSVVDALPEYERVLLENYCAGVNKIAKNLKVYPAEFYLTMTSFEEYKPVDAAALYIFMM